MAFQCLPRISGFLFALCFAFAVAGCTDSEVKILPVVINNLAASSLFLCTSPFDWHV